MSFEDDIRNVFREELVQAIPAIAAELLRQQRAEQDREWEGRRPFAEKRQISVDTVDRMAERGELEVKRMGRRVLVREKPRASDAEIARLAAEARGQ